MRWSSYRAPALSPYSSVVAVEHRSDDVHKRPPHSRLLAPSTLTRYTMISLCVCIYLRHFPSLTRHPLSLSLLFLSSRHRRSKSLFLLFSRRFAEKKFGIIDRRGWYVRGIDGDRRAPTRGETKSERSRTERRADRQRDRESPGYKGGQARARALVPPAAATRR